MIKCNVCEKKKAEYIYDCSECKQTHKLCCDCIHINNCIEYEKLKQLKGGLKK